MVTPGEVSPFFIREKLLLKNGYLDVIPKKTVWL
jgi:hypothetical protein